MDMMDEDVPKLKHFDWDKAKNFYYIVKLGGQKEASQFLNIAPSALSRQISILESELGCLLLKKNGRGSIITRNGEEFFKIVEDSFIKLKAFSYSHKAMTANGKKRKIRISTTHAIATYILNKHLIDYSKKFENVVFEVNTDDHLVDLYINDVDIAIRPYDEEIKDVYQEHLFTLKKNLFASEEYLNEYGNINSLEDLKNHKIIIPSMPKSYPYSDVEWIAKIGLSSGQRHEPIYSSNSLECLVHSAEAGLGIIGGYEKMSIIKNSHLKKILPDYHGPIIKEYIIYPNHLIKDKEFLNIKDFLKNCLYNKDTVKC